MANSSTNEAASGATSSNGETLVTLIAREKTVRDRIIEHDKTATAERKRLEFALDAVRQNIGCAMAGLDLARIDNALGLLKVYGSYKRGGDDRASVIRDAVDWFATGKCNAYQGLDRSNFGTKNYDRWAGQRSDHEWGGPRHGSLVFELGLKDRKREMTEAERADAIYFLLNIEAWETARATVPA